MKLSQYGYEFNPEMLARYPAENRDEARLMVVNRDKGTIEHRIFKDIIDYFDEGDLFVFNDTKVFPARLYGNKEKTGAEIEIFLLRELNRDLRLWDVLVDPARKIRIGNKLYFGDDDLMVAEVIDNTTSRGRTLRFLFDGDYDEFKAALFKLGETPLPRWVREKVEPEDAERYQTIFADKEAMLTARLRSTSGRAATPEQLQGVIERIRRALPEMHIPPIAVQEDIMYVPQPERMALYGVSYSMLFTALRNALNENTLFTINSGNESLPVVVGSNIDDLNDLLEKTFVKAGDAEIPVGVFMKQTRSLELKSIVAGEEGDYYPLELAPASRDVDRVMRTVRDCVAEAEGFEVSFSGSYFTNREMVRQLVWVLVIALLLLYFILAAQFESLVQPLIILSEIVIDLFGAIVILWIFGQTLNLMSMIGLIVVCGIVINDSILKIDTINTLRRRGMRMQHAILEAGRRRLKPIVMTSLTTILAVVPFLARGDMGSDLQYPMSLVIIGGMIVGTLISVLFIPVAYYEIYKSQR